jgi:nitrite reductase/ring-hydroxylating ferredoxin subunit
VDPTAVSAPPVSELKVLVGPLADLPDGQRKVIDTPLGAVIVTNQAGSLYAVNAKCPHLGLPMKTGEIGPDAVTGQPIITCKFHNSKFNLEDGKCVTWCSGVMGIPGTEKVAGAMGKFGGKANSPATVYPVLVVDGQVYVDLESSSSSVGNTGGNKGGNKGGNAVSIFDPLGMAVKVPVVGRPRPPDSRICLSLLDSALPPGGASKTIELNLVANCVSRSMLYGTKRDKDEIATYLDEMAVLFPSRWRLSDGVDGQEVRFIKALSVLLRSGLTSAAEATTFIGGPTEWMMVGRESAAAGTTASASATGAVGSTAGGSSSSGGLADSADSAASAASATTNPTALPNVAMRGMQLTHPTPPQPRKAT